MFDTNLPVCEDYDMWLRICAYEKVLFVEESLIKKYGGHADQLSHAFWGMDRFRIEALKKILDADQLDDTKRQATIQMILQKIEIVLAGAKKRGKLDNVSYYSEMYDKYISLNKS
jgi:hypothetical protein